MKRPIFLRAARRCQSGLTLVELMIALVINLFVILAVLNLYLANQQTYRFQEGLSRVQENARFTLHHLGAELRRAGYTGCARHTTITNQLDPNGSSYNAQLHGIHPDLDGVALLGWEAAGTAPGDSYTLGAASAHTNATAIALPAAIANDALWPGSDILIVNRAEPTGCLVASPAAAAAALNLNGACPEIAQGGLVIAVTANCTGGDLWQRTNAATAVGAINRGASGTPGNTPPGSTPFANLYDPGAQILRYRSTAFYVRSNAAGAPVLVQRDWPFSAAAEELVDGVESLQLVYGIDTDNDLWPNNYVSATAVDDWNQVVSVRAAILLRSPEPLPTQAELQDYNLAGVQLTPTAGGHVRQVVASTFSIRNRLP